ncbi:hypothetical protein [Proteus phage RP7]|nr:hypothetical protein [Proteus phage RP7]
MYLRAYLLLYLLVILRVYELLKALPTKVLLKWHRRGDLNPQRSTLKG